LSQPVFIKCRCCQGRGEIELTGPLSETLDLLRKHPGFLNGAALARLAKIKPTAMCQRLKRLEAMGLARSRLQCGRQLFWTSIEPIAPSSHKPK
jgi:hypothetical protein